MNCVVVVRNRGYSAFAIDGTPLRFEMHQDGSKRWRWHSWHVLGYVQIGSGVSKTKALAIEDALASLGLKEATNG